MQLAVPIERELADVTPEERKAERQVKPPGAGAYAAWLMKQRSWTMPKSLTG